MKKLGILAAAAMLYGLNAQAAIVSVGVAGTAEITAQSVFGYLPYYVGIQVSGSLDIDDTTNTVVGGTLTQFGGPAENTNWVIPLTGSIVDVSSADNTVFSINSAGLTEIDDDLITLECDSVEAPGACLGAKFADPGSAPFAGRYDSTLTGTQGWTVGGTGAGDIISLGTLGVHNSGNEGANGLFAGGDSMSHQMSLTVTPIPIPAAAWLFASAIGLLGFARRRMAGT